ncbi:MAG: VWA domain-containing protein [Pseudomonadota bacterium]
MTTHRFSLLVLPLLSGCLSMSTSYEFGATQGGVQDMGLAREMIASGYVPPPEAFVVEGMFSEHDLGLEGEACETLLCLRAAGGSAPDGDGNAAGFVQVGMSSTIDPDHYDRPSVTLVAVVDVSGSMGWDYSEYAEDYATPGALSHALLREIVDELDSHDRIAIVTYGSRVRTALDFTDPTDAKVNRAIHDLHEGGSTNMEGGLERAYELARDADFGTDEVRLALFTDVQPNVGATASTDFERMAEDGAEDGIGLTVFALGTGMGQEVLLAMSHLRGGNAFSLFTHEDVDELMEDSWPWMFSPIAYDLAVSMESPAGFSLARGYGFPAGTDDSPGSELEVATVFLSRRKGAMLLQLTPDDGEVGPFEVSGTISYRTPAGAARTAEVQASFDGELDERGQGWEQHSVGRTAALALLVDGMKNAATAYQTDHPAAVVEMTSVHERFAADATALADDDLPVEVQLAADLLALMEADADQADSLYYGY